MLQLWITQAAIVWLGYGLFEMVYGDGGGCGGPDVVIPYCR